MTENIVLCIEIYTIIRIVRGEKIQHIISLVDNLPIGDFLLGMSMEHKCLMVIVPLALINVSLKK